MRWTSNDIAKLQVKGMVRDMPKGGIVIDNAEVFKKVKKEMKHTESDLQQNCVKTFRLIYPRLKMRLFSIPNSGIRNIINASIMQQEGMMPGVSDVFLAVPKGKYGGMFIEFKSPVGRLSDYQKQFIEEVKTDYYCIVCRSVEQFLQEVKNYLG